MPHTAIIFAAVVIVLVHELLINPQWLWYVLALKPKKVLDEIRETSATRVRRWKMVANAVHAIWLLHECKEPALQEPWGGGAADDVTAQAQVHWRLVEQAEREKAVVEGREGRLKAQMDEMRRACEEKLDQAAAELRATKTAAEESARELRVLKEATKAAQEATKAAKEAAKAAKEAAATKAKATAEEAATAALISSPLVNARAAESGEEIARCPRCLARLSSPKYL